jgi:hypothetical protein
MPAAALPEIVTGSPAREGSGVAEMLSSCAQSAFGGQQIGCAPPAQQGTVAPGSALGGPQQGGCAPEEAVTNGQGTTAAWP